MFLSIRTILSSGLVAASVAAPFALQDAPQRIAFVDTSKILAQAPGRAEAEAVLAKEYTALQGQLKVMNEAAVKAFSDYQGLAATTPQAEKDRRLKLVTDKQTELQQKQREFDAQMTARQNEMLQPFVDQAKIALEDLRVEGRWTYILEAGQGGSIVAADKNLDITDRAIAKLRTMPKPSITPGKADSTAKKPVGAPLNDPAGIRPTTPGTPAKRPDFAVR